MGRGGWGEDFEGLIRDLGLEAGRPGCRAIAPGCSGEDQQRVHFCTGAAKEPANSNMKIRRIVLGQFPLHPTRPLLLAS